ncbi:MAG: NAD-dependent deacylase [Thermoplasmatales archaeon]|nr:NAD-dependent deacylase [Thermoplasmatales archaeon]
MKEVANEIKKSKFCIALTGAGISTESGIPDFRSKDGIWSRYDINEYGTIESFIRNPSKVWRLFEEMIKSFSEAKPNKAHLSLAEMEREGIIKAIITQNVDNLHAKAGSKNIIEFHGNFSILKCIKCGKKYELEKMVRICECGGLVKPNIIMFGEEIPKDAIEKSFELAEKCDLILVVGTSCSVYPAGYIPIIAKRNGAKIVEINKEETEITHLADYVLRGKCGEIISKIFEEIKNLH